MADQKLLYSLEGDASGLKKALADAESAYQKLNAEMTRQAVANSSLNVAEGDLKKLEAAAIEAKQKLDFLKRGVEIAPGNIKAFTKDIDQATKDLDKLSQKLTAQRAVVTDRRGTAGAADAGVAAAQQAQVNAEAQKHIALLQAEATETERVAAIEHLRAADEAAATRAAQANARVRIAAQQAGVQSAQSLSRLQGFASSLPRFDLQGNAAAKLAEINTAAAASKLRFTEALTAAQNFGRGGQSAAQGMTGQLKAMVVQALAVGSAIQGIRSIVETGIGFERATSKLMFANGGDAKAAADDLAFVRAEANRLALPVLVLANNFGDLNAAVQGTKTSGKEIREIFSGISQAARVLKLPEFKVDRAFLAIQQALSKEKLQADELTNQLAEAIPGPAKLIARGLGIEVSELMKRMKNGTQDAIPAVKALVGELNKLSDPGLANAMNSLQAKSVLLSNSIIDFKQTLAEAGLFDTFKEEIDALTEKLRKMADTGELQAFAKDFAQVVSDIARILGTATKFAIDHRQAIANLAVLYGGFKIAKAVQGVEIAWAAATAATVASGGAIVGVTARAAILLAMLGGPVGITVAILAAAAAWAIFRESASDAADAAINTLKGANHALAESIKQFNAGGLAGDAAVSAATKNAENLKKAYVAAVVARSQLSGQNAGEAQLKAADRDLAISLKNLEQAGKFVVQATKQRDQLAKDKPRVKVPTVDIGAAGKSARAISDNTDRLGLKSIDSDLAVLKDALKQSEDLYDNALKNEQISLEESQAAKLAIIQRGFDAEIEANDKKLAILSSAKPKDANEGRTFAADIAALQAKNVALGNEKAVREKLFADEARRGAVELKKQAEGFNADIQIQILRAQGQELAARLIEIDRARAEAMARAGADGGLVKALFDAQGAIARADDIKRQIDAVFEHARQRADDIKNNAATGALPEPVARNEQIASAQQAAAAAQPLIDALKAIIAANPQAFGPAAQEQVDEYGRRLSDIGKVADEVATRINGSISSGFEKLFSDIGTGAATAKEALRTFALGVVNEINAVVSKQLGQALFASLSPNGNSGGGVGGFFSSILGGAVGGKNDGSTAVSAIWTRDAAGGAAGALTGGKDGGGLFSGMFAGIGDFFSGLFASLKSGLSSIVSGIGNALSGLFSSSGSGSSGSDVSGWVSAIASAFGYAEGGWTGPGGKYQPAGIVHADEFVFDKVATNRIGVNALENMRRIASGSFVSSRPRTGYADGGLVNLPGSAAPSVTANTKIVNHWDSDAAMSDYLNTRSGERAILNIIQRNPNAA